MGTIQFFSWQWARLLSRSQPVSISSPLPCNGNFDDSLRVLHSFLSLNILSLFGVLFLWGGCLYSILLFFLQYFVGFVFIDRKKLRWFFSTFRVWTGIQIWLYSLFLFVVCGSLYRILYTTFDGGFFEPWFLPPFFPSLSPFSLIFPVSVSFFWLFDWTVLPGSFRFLIPCILCIRVERLESQNALYTLLVYESFSFLFALFFFFFWLKKLSGTCNPRYCCRFLFYRELFFVLMTLDACGRNSHLSSLFEFLSALLRAVLSFAYSLSLQGTLLKHKCEHILHVGVKESDVVYFYTTTAWMMWHWTVCLFVIWLGKQFRFLFVMLFCFRASA